MVAVLQRKAQLEDRLAALEEKLRGIDAELDSHQSRDWEELATERETDEVLESEGRAGKAEMAAIRAALKRIEAGTYGECVQCGDDIAEARLDVLPFTPLCAACATKLQR
ncbi:TraR/DksA family transcriptional regulator [Tropicimonas isoalkanivorans]|uniref:Transcriptional regulator, TraR/DksA family n=1 Tax=Tropicimonas isoalkanivorans TaxID=441112 RepID=A0A1I1GE39_9RHOB|nr:TraR/DksA family transcriptional regulator [Tropicimonas isoalkanivorans]SFC09841.1 transcriptional regulator, TraR/DksA family [Tropicimonas isoalkanivorans]